MDDPNGVKITLTGDCGHQFEVPVAGKNLDTMEFHCPTCRAVDRFSPDQVKDILAKYEAAKPIAVAEARASIERTLRDAFRR